IVADVSSHESEIELEGSRRDEEVKRAPVGLLAHPADSFTEASTSLRDRLGYVEHSRRRYETFEFPDGCIRVFRANAALECFGVANDAEEETIADQAVEQGHSGWHFSEMIYEPVGINEVR